MAKALVVIDMPKSCWDCPISDGEFGCCQLLDKEIWDIDERLKDCPLRPYKNSIPIEWIEERLKYALSFTHSEAEGKIVYDGCVITMVSASFTAQVLSNLLEAWEDENEKDI